MAKVPVEIIIKAIDGASGAIEAVRLRMAGISDQLKNVSERTKSVSNSMGMIRNVGEGIAGVGKSLTLGITAPIAGLAILSVRSAAQFETAMLRLQAATDAPKEMMQALQVEALRLGKTTQFSATEAAGAMVELGKAGFTAKQIMSSTGSVINLAGAEMMDLSEAATIVSDTMNQFSLQASDTTRITDVLAYAAGKSTTDVRGIAEALKYVGGIARTAGVSLEETSATVAILANRGVKGSMAGTALADAMNRIMVNPQAIETLQNMGIAAKDLFSGKKDGLLQLKSIASVLELLESKKISDVQIFRIFGEQAGRTVKQLLGQSQEIKKVTGEIGGAAKGFAAAQNEIKSTGFEGQLKRLKGAVEALMIGQAGKEGTGLLGLATAAVQKLSKAVTAFDALSPQTKQLIVTFAAVAAVLGPVLFIVGKLIVLVSSLVTAWTVLGPVLTGIVTAIGGVSLAMIGTVALVIAAIASIGAAIYLIVKHWDGLCESFAYAWDLAVQGAKDVASGFASWVGSVWDSIGAAASKYFSNIFDSIKTDFARLVGFFSSKVQSLLGFLPESIRTELGFSNQLAAPQGSAGLGAPAMSAMSSAMPQPFAMPAQENQSRVTVDFQNLPRGTRVSSDPRNSGGLDLSLGYSMVSP